MKIYSEQLSVELIRCMNKKYVDCFNSSILLCNKEEGNFEEFISEILNTSFKSIHHKDDLQELKNNTNRNRQKMKKRWYNAVIKEIGNPDSVKSTTVLSEMEGYKYMTEPEFKRAFKVKDIDELIGLRLKVIKKWSNSKKTAMIDFYYFDKKKGYQKINAFKNDIILEIINIIHKYFDGSITGYMKQRATELVENPVFAVNKSLISMDTSIDELSNNPVLYNDYQVTDDYILRTLIKEPDKVKLHQWHVLDERDSEIIDIIYSRIQPNFYKDKTIEIDIRDIVKNVYPSVSSYAYKDVEDRIMKISAYHIMGLIKEGENIKDTKFSINFFDNAVIYTDNITKKRVVKIVFAEILYDRYIKNKTVKVASYKFKLLKNNLSKILFFAFQKDRLEMGVSKSKDYIRVYPYLYFRHKVRFREKRKEANLKIIEGSLNHLRDNGVIIKDYQREGESFRIEFYPLSDVEKRDFGINNNDKKLK